MCFFFLSLLRYLQCLRPAYALPVPSCATIIVLDLLPFIIFYPHNFFIFPLRPLLSGESAYIVVFLGPRDFVTDFPAFTCFIASSTVTEFSVSLLYPITSQTVGSLNLIFVL